MMIGLAGRPVVALAVTGTFLYDIALFALKRVIPQDHAAVKERRNKKRGSLNVEAGFAALASIQKIAEATGANMFLMSGTLLGLYREGHLLAHDYDVDVGVRADDPNLPDFLAAMAAAPGLTGRKTVRLGALDCALNPWLGIDATQPVLHKFFFTGPDGDSPFGVDVFVHFEANGYLVHGNYRCLWINKVFDLVPQSYGGTRYKIPRDTRLYLRENYGDFETENKNFENSTDCPNSTNLYGIRAVSWLTGRYAYFLASGDARKRRIIGRRIRDCLAFGLYLKGRPQWSMHQYEDRAEGPQLDKAVPGG
jgi:hypothetical protein